MWGLLKETQEDMFKRLVEFKNRHGHCNVSKRYKDDPQLGSWVDRQRGEYKKNKMSQEQIRKFEKFGF